MEIDYDDPKSILAYENSFTYKPPLYNGSEQEDYKIGDDIIVRAYFERGRIDYKTYSPTRKLISIISFRFRGAYDYYRDNVFKGDYCGDPDEFNKVLEKIYSNCEVSEKRFIK